MKRINDYQKDASKLRLTVTQLSYPPGGYAVGLKSLTVTFTDKNGNQVQRAPEIWCRNLHEVGEVLTHRPHWSTRKKR